MGVRSKTIFRNGKVFAEYIDGVLTYLDPEYEAPKRSDIAAPMVVRDIREYQSPLDGSMITSRSAHREHMARHDVIEIGNEPIGNFKAHCEPPVRVDRDLGMQIKQHLEQVAAASQVEYDAHVNVQQHEHAEVASLVTAG